MNWIERNQKLDRKYEKEDRKSNKVVPKKKYNKRPKIDKPVKKVVPLSEEERRARALLSKKKYRERHKEEIRLHSKEYNNKHKEENRKRRLEVEYKISADQYDQLLKEQNGVCAICGKPSTTPDKTTGLPRRLAVDHDHQTGAVRGLLCGSCNLGLGNLKDSIEILEKAIKYIKRSVETLEL